MNWYQVVLLLVTIVCIGAPMFYVLGIKEKEMHQNVEEIYDVQELRLENAKLRELVVQSHECKTNDGCCEDCYQDEGCCPIERDMEELGIEAD